MTFRTIRIVLAAVALHFACGFGFASSAAANAGPHGDYSLTTDACAGCHRAHTSEGAGLFAAANEYELCITCHGGLVQTDVVNGRRTSDGARLNGGGFVAVNATPATSTHTVLGLGGSDGQGTAWGGASSGAGVPGTLKCSTCHDPHGSTNYRLLRDGDQHPSFSGSCSCHNLHGSGGPLIPGGWSTGSVLGTKDDSYAGGHNYASGDVSFFTSAITWDPVSGATPDISHGMSSWCGACHKQYVTRSGSAQHPSTDAAYYGWPGTQDALDGAGDIARYRHAVLVVPAATPSRPIRLAATAPQGGDPVNNPTYNAMTCLSCHFAHGTSAAASGYAAAVAPTNDSALLYYDNRGVCLACHQQGK